MQKKNKGFTLIELLVVVLIIGILAAIAVPQYKKAVEKSRATEAIQIMKNLHDAFAVYRMSNGISNTSRNVIDDLDISLDNLRENGSGEKCSKYFCYSVAANGSIQGLSFADGIEFPRSYGLYMYHVGSNSESKECLYTASDSAGKAVCESLKSQGWASEGMGS